MYASREARAAAIEADAGRPAAEHLSDLVTSAAAFRARLAQLPGTAEDVVLRMVSGAEVEAWEIVLLRIREVEIHHVDLAAGYGVDDWSDEFARRSLGPGRARVRRARRRPLRAALRTRRRQLARRPRPDVAARAGAAAPGVAGRALRRSWPRPGRPYGRPARSPVVVRTRCV